MSNWLSGVSIALLIGVAVFVLTGPVIMDQSLVNKAKINIMIITAETHSQIGANEPVIGRVSDAEAQVWLVLHPVQSHDCWLQGPVNVRQDGSWHARVVYKKSELFTGDNNIEVRAVANPERSGSDKKVTCWPAAEAISAPVFVSPH